MLQKIELTPVTPVTVSEIQQCDLALQYFSVPLQGRSYHVTLPPTWLSRPRQLPKYSLTAPRHSYVTCVQQWLHLLRYISEVLHTLGKQTRRLARVCKTSDMYLNKKGSQGYAAREVAGLSPVEGLGNIKRQNRRVLLQGRFRDCPFAHFSILPFRSSSTCVCVRQWVRRPHLI